MPRRNYPLPSVTYDASDSPNTTNDLPSGILAGSSWHDNNANKWYWCANHANDSAVWKEMVFADGIEGIVTPFITDQATDLINSLTPAIVTSGATSLINSLVPPLVTSGATALINSLVPPMIARSYGGLKLQSATTTNSITLNTFKRMSGTTVGYAEMLNFSHIGNNQLRYDGASSIKCKLLAFATGKVVFATGANFQLTIAKNGTPISGMAQTDSIGSVLLGALSTSAIPLQCLDTLTINQNDVFEIQVTSSSHTSLSIANAGLFIKQL